MDDLSDQNASPTEEPQSAAPSVGLLLGMFTFWAALLLAGAAYAAVALSPGLLQWFQLREQDHQNASQVLRLERGVSQLQHIRDSLEQDADFREQQAAPGSTIERELRRIDSEQSGFRSGHNTGREAERVFGPGGSEVLQAVGRDDRLRQWLLYAAALIVLLAFTFLNPAGGSVMLYLLGSPAAIVRGLARRYSGSPGTPAPGQPAPPGNESIVELPQLRLYVDESAADQD